MQGSQIADVTLVSIVGFLLFLFFIYKIGSKWTNRADKQIAQNRNSASIMIVTGSGGHTREILCLVDKISSKYSPRYYIIADTDQISEQKVHALEQSGEKMKGTEVKYSIHKIPRSREVNQSWVSTVISTLHAILYSFPLIFQIQPDIILCNGPGTCIPVCFAGLILKLFCIKQTLVIYVESICRVESLSVSAKILYYLADHILVQWPQLKKKYPKCQFIGRIV